MHSTDNGSESGGEQASARTAVAVSGPTSVSVAAATAGSGARECAGCGKRITERFLLKALDLFWHEDCLKCGCCDCRLGEVGSTLYTKANLILCKRDYLRLFGTTGYCAACNKVIPAFEMVMRAKSNVYHLECFACQQCNHRFCVGDRFYLCDNKILCEYDYEERLVFANMAYNPSSLAHIRRQVNNLQPAGDNTLNGHHLNQHNRTTTTTTNTITAPAHPNLNNSNNNQHHFHNHHHHLQLQQQQQHLHHLQQQQQLTSPSCYSEKSSGAATGQQRPPSSTHRGDDGSSGYGSPDSETFEPPQ